MTGQMVLRIWDVEHGACAMLHHNQNGVAGRLAMIDSGDTPDWRPSTFIRQHLSRTRLDYLFITNADQDHMSDLQGLWDAGIEVPVVHRNPDPPAWALRMIKERGGTLTADAKRYLDIHNSYNAQVTEPFNAYMGGITMSMFWNTYPRFMDTNNLSLAVFIQYAGFKILFPGDLEVDGWLACSNSPCLGLHWLESMYLSLHTMSRERVLRRGLRLLPTTGCRDVRQSHRLRHAGHDADISRSGDQETIQTVCSWRRPTSADTC